MPAVAMVPRDEIRDRIRAILQEIKLERHRKEQRDLKMEEVASTSGTSSGDCATQSSSSGTIEVPVFYPSIQEMRDFPAFLRKVEEEHHAHLTCGIAKIVPPPEFRSRKSGNYSDVDNYVIEQPVKEKVEGLAGVYSKTNKLYRRSMTVREFRALATKMRFPKGNKVPLDEVEKYYWKSVLAGEPIYGADTPGSICDPDLKEFNMNHLGTILDLLDDYGVKIKGVNTVYLYFGMWKTTFPWHSEDMDLYSINYVHFGEPKFWYAIATESTARFERFASQCFPDAAKSCKSFLRHKNYLISPHVLKKNNIRFGTVVQYANEFIITFPRGYHMGFNMGYNCAESTNFASDRWIDFGKNALVCTCRPDSVEIDMRPFMKNFRPEEYAEWHQYWYGERIVREKTDKKKGSSASKRQPLQDDSLVEKKRRRTDQLSRGARGSHIESSDPNGDSTPAVSGEPLGVQDVNALVELITNNKWKKEVRDLWSTLPGNLYAEKEFNNRRACESPYCAVCQYFVPKPLIERKKALPPTSRRLVKRAWFAKIDPETYPVREAEGEDRLFRCANCYVVVHEGCYPIGRIPADVNQWKCARCRRREDTAVRSTCCHLCELRGGALIPAEDSGGDFVHVICALLNRRTIFVDPVALETAYTWPPQKLRAPVKYADRLAAPYLNAFGEASERGKFQCEYCQHSKEGLLKCLVCDETMFHATCGRLAGVSFEFRKWPDLTVAVCPDHNEVSDDNEDVSVGDKVRVSVDEAGGRLAKGVVTSIERQDCCTVNFMDRNWSDDMLPTDIIDCECKKLDCNGWHVPGAKIRLRWDDGTLYDGVFRNRYVRSLYTVQLTGKASAHAPDVVTVSREGLFTRGEKPISDVSSD